MTGVLVRGVIRTWSSKCSANDQKSRTKHKIALKACSNQLEEEGLDRWVVTMGPAEAGGSGCKFKKRVSDRVSVNHKCLIE